MGGGGGICKYSSFVNKEHCLENNNKAREQGAHRSPEQH